MAFLCLQKEFFQDDVYSDTAVWWEPALTGSAWLSGSNDQHKKISLKPKDMTPGAGNDTYTHMPLSSMPVTPNQDSYIYSLRVSTRHVLVCLFPIL